MAWFDPRAVAHRRKMFTRHDAWRWAPPGSPEAKMPGWADPSAIRVRFKEAQEEEARAQDAAAREELNRALLQMRRELAELKYELAWRRLCRKYGYTPNEKLDRKWDGQPRDDLGRFDFGKKPDEQPDAADNSGRTDPLVVSDVEETVSGEEFAQGRRIGTARVRIGDRIVEVEGGQAARLVEAQARADSAIARVREIDPGARRRVLRRRLRGQFAPTSPKPKRPRPEPENSPRRALARGLSPASQFLRADRNATSLRVSTKKSIASAKRQVATPAERRTQAQHQEILSLIISSLRR